MVHYNTCKEKLKEMEGNLIFSYVYHASFVYVHFLTLTSSWEIMKAAEEEGGFSVYYTDFPNFFFFFFIIKVTVRHCSKIAVQIPIF